MGSRGHRKSDHDKSSWGQLGVTPAAFKGLVVWARVTGFPSWPAQVFDANSALEHPDLHDEVRETILKQNMKSKNAPKPKVPVPEVVFLFFKTEEWSTRSSVKEVEAYNKNFAKNSSCRKSGLAEAVAEAAKFINNFGPDKFQRLEDLAFPSEPELLSLRDADKPHTSKKSLDSLSKSIKMEVITSDPYANEESSEGERTPTPKINDKHIEAEASDDSEIVFAKEQLIKKCRPSNWSSDKPNSRGPSMPRGQSEAHAERDTSQEKTQDSVNLRSPDSQGERPIKTEKRKLSESNEPTGGEVSPWKRPVADCSTESESWQNKFINLSQLFHESKLAYKKTEIELKVAQAENIKLKEQLETQNSEHFIVETQQLYKVPSKLDEPVQCPFTKTNTVGVIGFVGDNALMKTLLGSCMIIDLCPMVALSDIEEKVDLGTQRCLKVSTDWINIARTCDTLLFCHNENMESAFENLKQLCCKSLEEGWTKKNLVQLTKMDYKSYERFVKEANPHFDVLFAQCVDDYSVVHNTPFVFISGCHNINTIHNLRQLLMSADIKSYYNKDAGFSGFMCDSINSHISTNISSISESLAVAQRFGIDARIWLGSYILSYNHLLYPRILHGLQSNKGVKGVSVRNAADTLTRFSVDAISHGHVMDIHNRTNTHFRSLLGGENKGLQSILSLETVTSLGLKDKE